MTQQEIQERNKQIALMLWGKQTNPIDREPEWHIEYDLPYCDEDGYYQNIGAMIPITVSLMQFHSDWRWLMEAKRFAERKGFDISIRGHDIMVYRPFRQHYNVRLVEPKLDADVDDSSIIEAVFIAVSDFAKLFNDKKL